MTSAAPQRCVQPRLALLEIGIESACLRRDFEATLHGNVFDFSQLLARSTERYLEFVRVSSFSVGIYVLDGGALDHQKPHSEDEVYYVVSGQAKMKVDSDGTSSNFDVGPGSIICVPARVHHAFYDITERLAVLVFFGPKPSVEPSREGC